MPYQGKKELPHPNQADKKPGSSQYWPRHRKTRHFLIALALFAKKKYKNEDEIFISRLYNLVLNLCNQVIYDYTYVFTKNDFVFILDNDINVMDLLNEFTEDVQKMRKRNRKS